MNIQHPDGSLYQTASVNGSSYPTKEWVEYLYAELNHTPGKKTAQKLISLTMNQAVIVMVAKPGWITKCHYSSADAQLTVLSGKFFIKKQSTEVISLVYRVLRMKK